MPCRTVNSANKKQKETVKRGKSYPWVKRDNEWCLALMPTRAFTSAGGNMGNLRETAGAARISGWGPGSPNLSYLQTLDMELQRARAMIRRLRIKSNQLTVDIMNGRSQSSWLVEVMGARLEGCTRECVQIFHDRLLMLSRADQDISIALNYEPKFGPLPLKTRDLSGCGACSNRAVTSRGGFGLCFVCADNALR